MPIRENREYRDMPILAKETREQQEVENNYVVEGYASTFGEYKLFEMDGCEYYERIEPSAFDNTDMSDVVLNIDHEGRVYARTRNNSLELSVDENGLKVRADLSKSTNSRNLYEDIECGNYDRMSFAFIVDKDSIVRDSDTKVTRIIQNVSKMFDVSAVSFPANPGTDIGVSKRSLFDGFIEQEKLELVEQEKRHQLELAKAKFEFATARKD